jgi:hypothetical protein
MMNNYKFQVNNRFCREGYFIIGFRMLHRVDIVYFFSYLDVEIMMKLHIVNTFVASFKRSRDWIF